METFSQRLKSYLLENGASIVGFGDLSGISSELRSGFPIGISIGVSLEPKILGQLVWGPSHAYYENYENANRKLEELATMAEHMIQKEGYQVLAKDRKHVKVNYQNWETVLPHKTVATRSGMGWIGKNAMLITKEFGSGLRIISVLTDAPLVVDSPINDSHCGHCKECQNNCPGEAIVGNNWTLESFREKLLDFDVCRRTGIKAAWKIKGGETHCGLCVVVCPWTQKYIQEAGYKNIFPVVEVAQVQDLEEILDLQKLAYQSEGIIYQDQSLPPLVQTLDELIEEEKDSIVLKVVKDRRIIGSVRLREHNGTCYIGKLIVHPDYQNQGVGTKIMTQILEYFGEKLRLELYTGSLSTKNIIWYKKFGFTQFKEVQVSNSLTLVYLQR